jgi:hypothetical protein
MTYAFDGGAAKVGESGSSLSGDIEKGLRFGSFGTCVDARYVDVGSRIPISSANRNSGTLA